MLPKPLRTWVVLAKCAAGLVAIALIAIIGVNSRLDGATAQAGRNIDTARNTERLAERDRRQTFNERRERFERHGDLGSVAGKSAQPGNRLSMELR